METRRFQPLYTRAQVGATASNGTLIASVTLAATASAQSINLPGPTQLNTSCQIQITNQSGQWAYVNFGQSGAVTAATVAAGYPVAPGVIAIVTVDSEVTAASCILASSTGNVTFTRGEGL